MGILQEQQFGRKWEYFKIRSTTTTTKILADVQFWVMLSKLLDFGIFESFLLWFPSFNRIVVNVHNPNSVSPSPIAKVGK